jgi:hypothetical protein
MTSNHFFEPSDEDTETSRAIFRCVCGTFVRLYPDEIAWLDALGLLRWRP